jgi:hypothetical protein
MREEKTPPPANRRVIQITAVPESDNHSLVVFALTDDGSVLSIGLDFARTPPDWGSWQEVPPLPPRA